MLLSTNELIRFDDYGLDLRKRVLTHLDAPVTLTPKAFDVLVFLAMNPGRVVTKEEILESVWSGSFVEEGNLPKYISQLRRALGEKSPLIVTVPGRGYQFAAQAFRSQAETEIAAGDAAGQRPGDILVQRVRERTEMVYEDLPVAQTVPRQPALVSVGASSRHGKIWRWVAISALVGALIALAADYAWKRFAPPPQLSDIVLADFVNTTRDSTFDSTLNQALEIDLEQSPYLNLLPRQKVRETLAQMERGKDEMLTPELAREVCERNNAQAVLHGTIANFGSKYLLTLTAEGCADGRQIAAYKQEAASKEEILGALDEAASRVRKRLGESAASLAKFQIPVEQATTSSLEALRAFSLARDRYDHGDWKTAENLYKEALALDPNFASAYTALGSTFYVRADYEQAAVFYKKGFDLRGRTSEHERLSIEISYHMGGDYDYEEGVRSLKLFNRIYPNEALSWGRLCNLFTQMGEYGQAVEAGEQAYRIDPHSSFVMTVLARAYKRANRFSDAKRVANASIVEGKDNWGTHSILFQIAYAEHDVDKIKSEGEWGLSHQHVARSLDDLGCAAATSGKLRVMADDLARAQTEGVREGDADFVNQVLIELSLFQFELGDSAKAAATLKLKTGDGGDPGGLAAVQALTGDLAPARRYVAEEESKDSKNTEIRFIGLPLLRARLALADHKPSEAIQLLEPARPYQLRDFYVPSLRAQTETEAGLLDAAIADYRLILANQGVDPISPLYSLAHLRLARVLVQQNKREEARQQYLALFDAWKNADSNQPLLQAARREFAKLQ